MQVRRTIDTPWAPYGVSFSRDGHRLAIAGGTYYGGGGVALASVGEGDAELHPLAELVPPEEGYPHLTGSGACFSDDDAVVAVSTRGASHRHGPTILLDARGLELRHRCTLRQVLHDESDWPCPTGVLLAEGRVIVRNNAFRRVDVIASWTLPDTVPTARASAFQHLNSARAVVVGDSVVTGGGGGSLRLTEWRADLGWSETGKACDGLLRTNLDGVPREPLPVPDCRRVTAIAVAPAGRRIVIGGLDGEVDAFDGSLSGPTTRLRPKSSKPDPGFDRHLAWATYTPASVVGACSLADGERWATVDASGELLLWRDDSLESSWQLPVQGTPRAIAAHPFEPWLAVALKEGSFGSPGSRVLLVDVD